MCGQNWWVLRTFFTTNKFQFIWFSLPSILCSILFLLRWAYPRKYSRIFLFFFLFFIGNFNALIFAAVPASRNVNAHRNFAHSDIKNCVILWSGVFSKQNCARYLWKKDKFLTGNRFHAYLLKFDMKLGLFVRTWVNMKPEMSLLHLFKITLL